MVFITYKIKVELIRYVQICSVRDSGNRNLGMPLSDRRRPVHVEEASIEMTEEAALKRTASLSG